MSKQVKNWSIVIFSTGSGNDKSISRTYEKMCGDFESVLQNLKNIKYYIFQLEKCPTTGSYHYDGFLHFSKPKRFQTVVNYFIKKTPGYSTFYKHPNVEIVRSLKAKMNYSSKEKSRVHGPFEWGTPPKTSGGGLELSKTTAELIKDGKSSEWFAYHRPELYLRYGKRLRDCINERWLYQNRNQFLTETENDEEEE